jgi:L-ectoine synthase
MIVRRLEDIQGTERDIQAQTWNSRRLLLRDEAMGFSLHDTLIHAGTETPMWYRHHLEAVYCIEGEGELLDVDAATSHRISAGTMYALERHDRHVLRAHTQMRMICVFNPPLTGRETHDHDGAYPLLDGTGEGLRDG